MRTVYSYNNVDAGFAQFTMLSSNFLNQFNLLLLQQSVESFYELIPSLCDLKQPTATQQFHRPVNGDPKVRSCCDVTYNCTHYGRIVAFVVKAM